MARQPREKTFPFRILAGIAGVIMRLIARFEVSGGENIPATGAFLVTPNHFSNADPVVVGLAIWRLGRAPHYLAKSSLFRVPVLGYFMRATGQVPVDRTSNRTSESLESARRIAANGQCVVVYPEGSLTRDPALWPMRGKSGAVRIALEANLPLIPAAHWGTQAIMGQDDKIHAFGRRKPVQVRFGSPVDLSAFRGQPLDAQTLHAATAVVMRAITDLLEQLRAETAPLERWDPKAHGQSEIGRIEPTV